MNGKAEHDRLNLPSVYHLKLGIGLLSVVAAGGTWAILQGCHFSCKLLTNSYLVFVTSPNNLWWVGILSCTLCIVPMVVLLGPHFGWYDGVEPLLEKQTRPCTVFSHSSILGFYVLVFWFSDLPAFLAHLVMKDRFIVGVCLPSLSNSCHCFS